MLTCPSCQFDNPVDHKFCQRCGEPLPPTADDEARPNATHDAEQSAASVSQNVAQAGIQRALQASLMPPDKLGLSPATFLDSEERYQVLTVLSQGNALIEDTTPEVRSPLQTQLPQLEDVPLATLQSIPELPAAAYPYLLLSESAPRLYDVCQQGETTILIMPCDRESEQSASQGESLVKAFSAAVDPLQHVYWMYTFTDLWIALEPVPQWRSSLLLANNLCISADQSLYVQQFIPPSIQPPSFLDLKAFLQSLLAQPHRGAIAPLRQIRRLILTVTSSQTLDQLRDELSAIGESLLATPAAITPTASSSTFSPAPLTPAPTPITQPDSPDTDNLEMPDSNDISSDDISSDDIPSDDDIDFIEPTDSDESMDESTMVLPMKLVAVEEAGRSDVGRQRDHNEDCFFISSSTQKRADNSGQSTRAHCLYVLCDGMGGHDGGEVASQLAAQTLSDYFEAHWPHPLPGQPLSPLPEETSVIEAVKLANQAIYDINEKEARAGHERMGTTLVIVLLQGSEAVVAHVGDSRLYQHTRRMGLRQVTTDHEVGQREIARGIPYNIAYARPDAYQLTQALGPRGSEDLQPSVSYLTFSEDTLLLLCSDGLSDNGLVEDYLGSHIDPMLRGEKDLEGGMDDLVNLANEVNGHDNISAIAIRLKVSPDLTALPDGSALPSETSAQTRIQ
ncbi:MAG: serine/threonine phosphatase [Phormidesmis sp.]